MMGVTCTTGAGTGATLALADTLTAGLAAAFLATGLAALAATLAGALTTYFTNCHKYGTGILLSIHNRQLLSCKCTRLLDNN